MAFHTDELLHDGELQAAISNAIVHITAQHTGRGPTRARTTIRGDVVLVMLEDTLTKGERSLVEKGREQKVLDFRHEYQLAMRDECVAAVEGFTGRTVLAFMSANHVEPDLGAEVFLLEPVASDGSPAGLREPEASV